MFSAVGLVLGLGLGLWLKRWWIVVVLLLIGLAVSTIGWQAAWFADEDTPASGGALLFELVICAPVAVGAAMGVYAMRSRGRKRHDDGSTLPVIGVVRDPGSESRQS
jgi:hypothetical protein